jgi:hypothetical protein
MREEARSYLLAPGGSCSNRNWNRSQKRKRKSKRNLIVMIVIMPKRMMKMRIALVMRGLGKKKVRITSSQNLHPLPKSGVHQATGASIPEKRK